MTADELRDAAEAERVRAELLGATYLFSVALLPDEGGGNSLIYVAGDLLPDALFSSNRSRALEAAFWLALNEEWTGHSNGKREPMRAVAIYGHPLPAPAVGVCYSFAYVGIDYAQPTASEYLAACSKHGQPVLVLGQPS